MPTDLSLSFADTAPDLGELSERLLGVTCLFLRQPLIDADEVGLCPESYSKKTRDKYLIAITEMLISRSKKICVIMML